MKRTRRSLKKRGKALCHRDIASVNDIILFRVKRKLDKNAI
jgi:hypothetical protein